MKCDDNNVNEQETFIKGIFESLFKQLFLDFLSAFYCDPFLLSKVKTKFFF